MHYLLQYNVQSYCYLKYYVHTSYCYIIIVVSSIEVFFLNSYFVFLIALSHMLIESIVMTF